MSDERNGEFRPLEAKIFFMLEARRERMGYTHKRNFYAWALEKDPQSAYRQYYRLLHTAKGTASPAERAYLSIEDASKLARALQIDLSQLVRDAEEDLGLNKKPFPIPSLPQLSKTKQKAS